MASNGHLHSAAVEATATASNQYASGTLEDGEIKQEQDDSPPHGNELQLSRLAYAALENRYSQLQHQHTETQALVAAYSEVIRGFAPAADGDVSIDQLQAEAGHDGLRARALETDALRSLIREAGGFRELEQVVSDLRRIRDMSDDLKSSRGIVGLASQVRDLLQCKQKLTKLQNEVNDFNGLKAKAARYERLMQAFADVQIDASPPQLASTFASPGPARNQMATQQPVHGSAFMNPARARMISARPIEEDPDRDLYEAPRVSRPQNQTGSNFTPLGNTNVPTATLKRKVARHKDPSATLKRPRVDLGRAAALVESNLPATTNAGRRFGTAAFGTRADTLGGQARSSLGFPTYTGLPEPASKATNAPASMPPRGFAGPGARSLDMGLEWQGTSKKRFGEPITQGAAEGFTIWDACQSYDLKKAAQIPDDLLHFLQSELAKVVSAANASKLTQMAPSGNTCIAAYMADGLRSDLPQDRRACQKCCSAARPCALLQAVSGVRTVIFLPIREHLRIGKEWTDKSYWVRDVV
ncbi:hypothetical protein E8E13_008308 [Curvularia kusanoi]|uniref:Uncharacterized protein n=1 Tax=Curvularia kusanoi TaxID=90978 RepID=A0A9P4WEN8_CURKU|nr:hypothetical protein E8E13_008308 [Curvularia kusanoi]